MFWRFCATVSTIYAIDLMGLFVRSLNRYAQGLPPEAYNSGPLILSVVSFVVVHSMLWKRGPLKLLMKEDA